MNRKKKTTGWPEGFEQFGLGVEIGDDPVPQNGAGDRQHIFCADVGTTVQYGTRLRPESDIGWPAGRHPS